MPISNAPQSVSRRYAHNLLCRGSNRTYELEETSRQIARTARGLPCGHYYAATIKTSVDFISFFGDGHTPVDAVVAALTSAGVTFR